MDHIDFRQTLKDEFNRRKGRNGFYSLRAYARDLDVSAARLSEILSGKKGISLEVATSFAQKLRLTDIEKQIFTLSVAALHSRSSEAKKAAQEKLAITLQKKTLPPRNSILVHWTTEAIQKLSERDGFKAEAKSLAKKLDLSEYLITGPLRYLTRAGLLPGVSKEKAYLSEKLRGKRIGIDYEQILELARKKFLTLPANAAAFEHEPLLLSTEDAKEAQRIIDRAYADLRRLQASHRKSKLYYFSSQFFLVEKEGASNDR